MMPKNNFVDKISAHFKPLAANSHMYTLHTILWQNGLTYKSACWNKCSSLRCPWACFILQWQTNRATPITINQIWPSSKALQTPLQQANSVPPSPGSGVLHRQQPSLEPKRQRESLCVSVGAAVWKYMATTAIIPWLLLVLVVFYMTQLQLVERRLGVQQMLLVIFTLTLPFPSPIFSL